MVVKREDLDQNEIDQLYYDEKLDIPEIAKKLNCSYNSIRRRIKELRPTEINRKDSYNWDHRLDLEVERLGESSEKDKKVILQFLEECKSERLSKSRLENYCRILRLSKRFRTKDLVDLTKKDLKIMFNNLEDSDLAEWTKQGYRIAFKKFFRWVAIELNGEGLQPKEYPEVVSWINTTIKANKTKLPEDMLTEEDIQMLIDGCQSIRNKALIALLWDSGCRIGELLGLKLKHINFDKYGATMIIQGKTGSRRIRLSPSVPYLANLKENHMDKNDPEAFLFVGEGSKNRGVRLGYNAIDAMLRDLKEKTEIKKKTNAHSFRHARASYLASRVREPVMKELFGWTQRSQMAAVYVHLSGRDIDNEKLKADGVILEEEKEFESKLKPKICPRCKKSNPATSNFCNSCSMVLDLDTAVEMSQYQDEAAQVMEKVMNKPEFTINKDTVKDALKELIAEGKITI